MHSFLGEHEIEIILDGRQLGIGPFAMEVHEPPKIARLPSTILAGKELVFECSFLFLVPVSLWYLGNMMSFCTSEIRVSKLSSVNGLGFAKKFLNAKIQNRKAESFMQISEVVPRTANAFF